MTPNATLRASAAGLDFIGSFEGLRLCAYRDAAGVLTIGYGHTKGVRPGQQVTADQARELLREDAETAARVVRNVVRVPLNQSQFDALVSLAFNIGGGAFAGSTVARRLNDGDLAGAAEALLLWDKATVAGKKISLPGLTRRRQAERKLFLSGVSSS